MKLEPELIHGYRLHSSTTFDILEEYQDDQGSILGDQAEELFVNDLMTKAQLGLEGLAPVSQSILNDVLLPEPARTPFSISSSPPAGTHQARHYL